MVLDERSRHELYLRLEATLGTDAADTMMEHLPPVGWADVATRRDLDTAEAALRQDLGGLEERTSLRIGASEDRMNGRFEAFEERMNGRFEVFEERMNGRFEGFEDRITSRMDAAEERTTARFEALEERSTLRLVATKNELLATFRGELHSAITTQTRTLALTLVGTMLSSSGLAFAAARLAG